MPSPALVHSALPVPKASGTHGELPQALDPLPSAKLWLVDGYNALHCAPFRSNPGSGNPDSGNPISGNPNRVGQKPFWSNTMRERLVAFARRFPDPHAEIWLVFDGPRAPEDPERNTEPKVTLQFSPSADDWIVKRVREEADPSTIAVVSGDRKLAGRARHRGAAVVSPRLFLDYCVAETTDSTQSC
jgi:predicted RNA-binding protein with PIN domain